ncbi:MAG: tyrosine-type recombinase/integrase [Gammaproteobacteria bacterium]|nr:tyrosine-type recombinase/integrase [Gammaproteobacteria bacterium]|tara:strand:- start:3113 stop:4072 length:960 start_codon:yes stop_codon:yes gene_type:complete
MEKPTNNHLWRCARYYFALCLAQGQSSDTVRSKTYALKKFCKWCFARNVRRIDDVDIALMDEYMAYLNAYRKSLDGQPLCAANKYALILCIKSFVKKMFNRGLLTTDKLSSIDLPTVDRPLPKAIFTAEEVEQILEQPLLYGFKGMRDRVILETLFATGIRRIELLHLDIEDVDFNQQLIRVRKGKGNREYILPVSDRAIEWLAFYLTKLRPKLATLQSGSALFLNDKGTRYRACALSDMASRYVRFAGFKRSGSCHLFRHATATIMLDNGADIRHVQEMLGHADIASTQIYTFVSRSKLRDVYNKTHPSALSDKRLFR